MEIRAIKQVALVTSLAVCRDFGVTYVLHILISITRCSGKVDRMNKTYKSWMLHVHHKEKHTTDKRNFCSCPSSSIPNFLNDCLAWFICVRTKTSDKVGSLWKIYYSELTKDRTQSFTLNSKLSFAIKSTNYKQVLGDVSLFLPVDPVSSSHQ